ncbi:hypothetical protein M8C21_001907, partial [Ambrosia artemisiifolia]
EVFLMLSLISRLAIGIFIQLLYWEPFVALEHNTIHLKNKQGGYSIVDNMGRQGIVIVALPRKFGCPCWCWKSHMTLIQQDFICLANKSMKYAFFTWEGVATDLLTVLVWNGLGSGRVQVRAVQLRHLMHVIGKADASLVV